MQVKLRDAFPQIEELSEPGGRKRWRLPPGTTGRMADPTVEDIAALHRGAELARQSGDPATAEALDRLSDRLPARLPAQQRSRLEPDIAALLEADGVALRPGPRERIPPETLHSLREAILAGVWIEADHRARASGLVSRNARLGPLAMLLGEGRQYLVAHSAWAGEVRLFALAGFERIEVEHGAVTVSTMHQRNDRANAWHRHQPATDRNLPRKLADMAFKVRQFSPQCGPRAAQRFGCRFQHRIACRKFADPLLEPATRYDADLESEVPKEPAQ